MKRTLFHYLLTVACAFLLVAPAQRLLAGPGSAELLKQAYIALGRADHDYKGHRLEAMKHVEAAGKEMGLEMHGEGKGHEKQWVSDDQLREAKGLLEQALPGLAGKAAQHTKKAIEQINASLNVK